VKIFAMVHSSGVRDNAFRGINSLTVRLVAA
jgi:hypothetical protein